MRTKNKNGKANGPGTTGHHGLKQVEPGISERVRTAVSDREKHSPLRVGSTTAPSQMANGSNGKSISSTDPSPSPGHTGPFKVRKTETGEYESSPSLAAAIPRTFGTTDPQLTTSLFIQVRCALPHLDVWDPEGNYILAALYSISPRDAVEGMLAVQMVVAHCLSMEFFRRSGLCGQLQAGASDNVNLAAKLQKNFVALNDALERHRANGLQRKDTPNVNLYDQAEAQGSAVPINHHGSGDAHAKNGKPNGQHANASAGMAEEWKPTGRPEHRTEVRRQNAARHSM
jgi:hypothetical protein